MDHDTYFVFSDFFQVKASQNLKTTTMHPKVKVHSPNVKYSNENVTSKYIYQTTQVVQDNGAFDVQPVDVHFTFQTETKVPKVGVMLVGWGGNNGTTLTAALLANKHNLTWETKSGTKTPNFYGSLLESSTVSLGFDQNGEVSLFDLFLPWDCIDLFYP